MHEASETLIANMAVGLADTAASLSHTSGFPLATVAVFPFGPSGPSTSVSGCGDGECRQTFATTD